LGKLIRKKLIGEDHKEKHEGEKNETSKRKTRKTHREKISGKAMKERPSRKKNKNI
jgi:hypothetical protein